MIGEQGTLWPIHPKPFEGEILSSWLSRTAAGHGLSLQQFHKLCLPRVPGQRVDLDQIDDEGFFAVLARGSGISVEDARRTGFVSDEGRIYSRVVFNNLEWIAPLSLQDNGPRRQAIPFCPSCLAADKVPYYRKRWRFAFHPVCPEHGLLTYECPRCGHHYGYLGQGGAAGISVGSGAIGVCRNCSKRFPATRILGATEALMGSVSDIQNGILSALDSGWTEVEGVGHVHVCLYLRGLHDLAVLLQHPQRGHDAISWIGHQMGIESPKWNWVDWRGSLESRPAMTRAWLLLFATWLLREWPNRFVALLQALELKPSQVLSPAADRPFWMVHHAIEEMYEFGSSRSQQEIESAKKVLVAHRGWAPSNGELKGFMRTGLVPDIKPLSRAVDPAARQILEVSEQRMAAFVENRRRDAMARKSEPPKLYPVVPLDSAAEAAKKAVDEISRDIPALDRWARQKRSTPDEA